ncbi:hypothetical protein E4T56_gene19066 [Termitomyces sp. T112]|nr:hypothetical protein E4T56_gene19066 [Termitomyces sp. T112]
MLLQVSEPLTIQVISHFVPQLIRDIDVTNDNENQVGYYVGLLHSLAQTRGSYQTRWIDALDGFIWALKDFLDLSPKSVHLCALDGNVGIIKSITAEITDSINIAQTYAYIPIAWSADGSVGSVIGGILFNPTARCPCLFAKSKVLKEHPRAQVPNANFPSVPTSKP